MIFFCFAQSCQRFVYFYSLFQKEQIRFDSLYHFFVFSFIRLFSHLDCFFFFLIFLTYSTVHFFKTFSVQCLSHNVPGFFLQHKSLRVYILLWLDIEHFYFCATLNIIEFPFLLFLTHELFRNIYLSLKTGFFFNLFWLLIFKLIAFIVRECCVYAMNTLASSETTFMNWNIVIRLAFQVYSKIMCVLFLLVVGFFVYIGL